MALYIRHMMKMAIMGCVLLILAACTNSRMPFIEEQASMTRDYQINLHSQGTGQKITETEKGYYFINGSYLYYMEKEGMKPVLLDMNANHDCSPDNIEVIPKNCNAYINKHEGFNTSSITYYGGHLYIVEAAPSTSKDAFGTYRYQLVQMKQDGASRKVLREFTSAPSPLVIHRDQIYYVDNTMNAWESISPTILTVPLDDAKQEAIGLYSIELKDVFFADLFAYNNNLYFIESGNNMYRTVSYDLLDKKTNVLFDEYTGNAGITSVYDDTLYFGLFTGDAFDEHSWFKYSSNLAGEDVKKLPIYQPIVSHLKKDSNFYYIHPVSWYAKSEDFSHVEDQMTIYNEEFNEINQLDLSLLSNDTKVVIGNEQHLFIQSMDHAQHKEYLYYLDKQTIGDENLKLQLIAESATPLPQSSVMEH